MGKWEVLAACPPAAMPTLERIVGSHTRLTFVNTLRAARDVLRTNPNVTMVICGVHFDESRMYDLLDYARRERPAVPFLCVRILDSELTRASRDGVALALRTAGAAAFVDFASLVMERGRSGAEHELETQVLAHLDPKASGL